MPWTRIKQLLRQAGRPATPATHPAPPANSLRPQQPPGTTDHGGGQGRRLWNTLTGHRLGGVCILTALALASFFLTRIVLLCQSQNYTNMGGFHMVDIFLFGLLNDLVVSLYATIPLTLWLALIPQTIFVRRKHQKMMTAVLFATMAGLISLMVAEIVFWDEFTARFNFIAIDYLIYTTEVLNNIWQSYPVAWMLTAVLVTAAGITGIFCRHGMLTPWLTAKTGWKTRWTAASLQITAVLLFAFFFDNQTAIPETNPCNAELARNGIHSLFAAYRHNELDYRQFYVTMPTDEIGKRLRRILAEPNATFVSDTPFDIRRHISASGPELACNVVVIVEESLSASFTSCLGGKKLTPNLDQLASQGMLFTKCFATGTRTVRGLEAIALSMPPTPGQSIVRRPHNGNLFSMGKMFRDRGYKTTFVYGGYGHFDNMNTFFSANGYDILDRSSPEAQPQGFSTAWGVCDGDMFQWALQAADAVFATGKPFHQLIMTTSNHRPYTFPENVVDAPQKKRSSAVRYSDHALGAFIRAASSKAWFANTIFVIVADHCHSTSGRQKLPLEKYHVPLLFYAPKLLSPRTVDKVCSQIDLAPTLFGLLNWSYQSEFYGQDLLRQPDAPGRAPLGTFQTLGLLTAESGTLTWLDPVKKFAGEKWSLGTPFTLLEARIHADPADCVALYQSAAIRQRSDRERNSASKHQSALNTTSFNPTSSQR